MKPIIPRVLSAAMLLALGGTASAQDVLVEGPGVKVGESTVLHPRVGVEAGVISNVFYEEEGERFSPIMRLLAGLDIAPAGEDRLGSDEAGAPTVTFRGGLEVEYQEYLTSNDAVQSQRNLDLNALGNLHFFPRSNASFSLQDQFQRLTRPPNFETSENIARDINHLIATFGFHPRGRTLSAAARYENIIDIFESDESEFANRIQHIVGLNGKWRFYPYSQLYIDASLGFYGPLGDNELAGMQYKVSSSPLRVIAGVDSLLTEKTTVKAYVGYANGFYEEGPSYSAPVGGVDLGWRYTPVGRLVVGYSYDVYDSINANYFNEHRLRADVTQAIGTVTIINAGLAARFRGYRGVPMALMPSDENRDDFILEARLRANWMLQDRFSLYAEYLLQSVDTEFRTGFDGVVDDPSYIRHEAWLGAVAAF